MTIFEVLTRRFWINYALILLVTCWIPLIRQESSLTDEDGKVISTNTRWIPLYESYYTVGKLLVQRYAGGYEELSGVKRDAIAQAVASHSKAILFHVGLSFGVSFWVWYAVLRTRKQVDKLPPGESA